MIMRIVSLLSITLLLFVYSPTVKAQGFGVFPISQSAEVQAGRSATLQFDLLNFSATEVTLEIEHDYSIASLDSESASKIANTRLQTLMLERANDHGQWFDVPTQFSIPANTDGGAATLSIPISCRARRRVPILAQ